ncbi:MAG: ABC transporter substrate-binding protein [Anaerolineaceae bacterium]|jgi:peptide/nickel transport system substrate-binding protein
MKRKLMLLLSMILVLSMVLAACGTPKPAEPVDAPVVETEDETPVDTPEEVTEEVVEPAEEVVEPEPEPTTDRKGGWLDEIVVSVIDNPSVITQLEADAIDIYVNGFGPNQLDPLLDSGLPYSSTNGTYYTIQFNPAVFADEAKFNPFTNRKIREAFNYLIDRNYINQEFYGGGALPKWFAIMTNFIDYADLIDKARELETKYAYNIDTAKEIIDAELVEMGATIEDGKYMYNGEPLEVTFLIRNDGDGTRLAWGNYLADQMETIGFTVNRQEGNGSDLAPIWIQGEPTAGEWHMYTGGWGASVLNRDQRNIFQEMYLNTSAQGIPCFQANVSDPEFQELGDRLYNGDYKTVEERREMMYRALELSLEDSFQVMVVDSKRFVPYREGVQVTYDLAAGVESAQIYPYTLRFEGQEGGTMRWATQPFLFAGPWNPIAGSNTTSDQGSGRATRSYDFIYDPYTGLVHPFRAERAELLAVEGLPIQKTLDWVTLETTDKIVVPDDAWVDWNAETQTFITNVEKNGDEEVTANIRSTVYYPADVFEKALWHDGSNVELADLLMSLIMTFDRAKPESAIYDKQAEKGFNVFMDAFRGFRLVSTEPLVVEWYSNNYTADAELSAYFSFWPNYSFAESSWPQMAMMNRTEADGLAVYTDVKANELEVEQISLIGGPTLENLTDSLDALIEEEYVPYEATLGQYLSKEQAVKRYEALKAHFETYGNYWQGTGPYFLKSVDLNGKSLVLAHFDLFTDSSLRWAGWAEPKIADVEIETPGQVIAGEEAVFDVFITFNGEPYLVDEIKQVKFIVYDATNTIIAIDDAVAVEDGHFTVTLSPEITALLGEGANKLEVAVVPFVVAQPTLYSVEFVSAK